MVTPLKCSNIYDVLQDDGNDDNNDECLSDSPLQKSKMYVDVNDLSDLDYLSPINRNSKFSERNVEDEEIDNSEDVKNKSSDDSDSDDSDDSDNSDDDYRREVEIDPVNIDIPAFLEICKNYQIVRKIKFMYSVTKYNGVGSGADKFCRTTMLKRVIEYYFDITDNWFMEPKWDRFDKNIHEQIVGFFRSCIRLNMLLPWHFSPRIIEALTHRTLQRDELMYFLQYVDPEIHRYVNHLDDTYKYCQESFNLLNTGHESLDSMIRDRIINRELTEKERKITQHFDFGPMVYDDLMKFDQMISEPYEFTNDMITNLFVIHPPCEEVNEAKYQYQKMWNQMIIDSTNDEKRGMLILFTGSSAIENEKINVYVNTYGCDIEIHACEPSGYVHKHLFESQEILNGLRIYFSDTNDIMDDN